MEAILIILVRLLVPLSILKYPLAGGILALLADAFDILVLGYATGREFSGFNDYFNGNYQWIDKLLDLYYLTLELVVAHRLFDALGRRTMRWLYAWRLAGIALFELTGASVLLVFTPNLVEYFYLAYLGIRRRWKNWQLTPRRLARLLLTLLVIKVPHEYILHVKGTSVWDYILATIGMGQ